MIEEVLFIITFIQPTNQPSASSLSSLDESTHLRLPSVICCLFAWEEELPLWLASY